MTDFQILSQLFKDATKVPLRTEYNKSFVLLDEPQATDSEAKIRNLPDDAIVIKIDAFRSPDNIFNGTKGECKRADYAIISSERKCILLIEIKRNKDAWCQVVKQLMGAKCFIKYCQEIGRSFWNDNNFLKGYRYRYVSIGHTSIPKRRTRITKQDERHDTPETALKIDWPNYLQFNMLVGGQ